MGEDQLQWAWKTLAFESRQVFTVEGEAVDFVSQGQWNRDQGPDFLGAEVRIAGLEHHGAIEIHLRSGDWFRHGHQNDPNYNGVILHVVASREEVEVVREDGTRIPEIVLGERLVPLNNPTTRGKKGGNDVLPCHSLLPSLPRSYPKSWLVELANQRLLEKAQALEGRLQSLAGDWDQLLWEGLAETMGGKVNGPAFRELALKIPVSKLLRNGTPLGIESMIFGTAGLLEGQTPGSGWPADLQREWRFLREKHGLRPQPVPLRYSRMRPASFPTIRLAQLSYWIWKYPHLVSLLGPHSWPRFRTLEIGTQSYWQNHSRLGEPQKIRERSLGQDTLQSIWINLLAPASFLYAAHHGRTLDPESILRILPPESNRVIREFAPYGLIPSDAFESQAILHLKKKYCNARECLNCAFGKYFLTPDRP